MDRRGQRADEPRAGHSDGARLQEFSPRAAGGTYAFRVHQCLVFFENGWYARLILSLGPGDKRTARWFCPWGEQTTLSWIDHSTSACSTQSSPPSLLNQATLEKCRMPGKFRIGTIRRTIVVGAAMICLAAGW